MLVGKFLLLLLLLVIVDWYLLEEVFWCDDSSVRVFNELYLYYNVKLIDFIGVLFFYFFCVKCFFNFVYEVIFC